MSGNREGNLIWSISGICWLMQLVFKINLVEFIQLTGAKLELAGFQQFGSIIWRSMTKPGLTDVERHRLDRKLEMHACRIIQGQALD
jgi:hypothetical protein